MRKELMKVAENYSKDEVSSHGFTIYIQADYLTIVSLFSFFRMNKQALVVEAQNSLFKENQINK